MKSIPISLALAAVFTVLTQFWACNPGRPWWRKRDLVTDLCYWFFIPVVTRYFRIGLLIAGAAVFFHITTVDGLIAFYENGHGPLASLPLVVQIRSRAQELVEGRQPVFVEVARSPTEHDGALRPVA